MSDLPNEIWFDPLDGQSGDIVPYDNNWNGACVKYIRADRIEKPLSDEEILQVAADAGVRVHTGRGAIMFARALEKRIKGG